jgi:TolA-binding protein
VISAFEGRYGEKDEYAWRMMRLKAWCNLATGNTDAAWKAFQGFAGVQKNSPEYAANLLEYAKVLIFTNKLSDAAMMLRELAGMNADSREIFEGRYLLGKALMMQGKPGEAVELLKRLCDNEKAGSELRAEAWFAVSRAWTAQGNTGEAVKAVKNGIALARGAELKKRANLALGELLLRSGKFEEGIPLLKGFITAAPADPLAAELQLCIAGALLDGGKNNEAVDEFQHYLETFTNSAGQALAYEGKGSGLFRLGRYGESAAIFKRAYTLFHDPVRKEKNLFRHADSFFANGQYKPAMEAYGQFLGEFSGSEPALMARFQIAESMARLGDFAGARVKLVELIGEHPATPTAEEARLRTGLLDMEQNKAEDAVRTFSELLSVYPKGLFRGDALYNRGVAYMKLRMLKEALPDFENVVRGFPDTRVAEMAAFQRAFCFQGLGREKEAIGALSDFCRKFPGSVRIPEAVFRLAQYEFNQGDREAAVKQFIEFAVRHKEHELAPDALLRAGLHAFDKKEYLKAIEFFNTIARDYPASRKLADARFAQANAMCELGKYADAILLFDEIIIKYSGGDLVIPAWGRKGDAHFNLGVDDQNRYEESIKCYDIVAGSAKSDRETVLQAQYKAGRSLEKLGRLKEALDRYYSRVMIPFLDAKGNPRSETEAVWFTRAAWAVIDLLEKEKDAKKIANVLERIVEANIPASAEARERIKKIKTENWWLFY